MPVWVEIVPTVIEVDVTPGALLDDAALAVPTGARATVVTTATPVSTVPATARHLRRLACRPPGSSAKRYARRGRALNPFGGPLPFSGARPSASSLSFAGRIFHLFRYACPDPCVRLPVGGRHLAKQARGRRTVRGCPLGPVGAGSEIEVLDPEIVGHEATPRLGHVPDRRAPVRELRVPDEDVAPSRNEGGLLQLVGRRLLVDIPRDVGHLGPDRPEIPV